MSFSFWARLGGVALATLAISTALAFTDVGTEHPNSAAIMSLTDKGILKGYADGSFKPGGSINRAEFLTVLLRVKGEDTTSPAAGSCFSDVALKAWYAQAACRGKELGIVNGGPDGRFRPGDAVTLVEAAKMMATSQGALVEMPNAKQEWYDPYLRYMEKHKAIPDSVQYVGQSLTRGDVAEIVWRITENRTDRPSIPAIELSRTPCTPFVTTTTLPGVDMRKVQSTWLGWYNGERAKVGAPALVIVPELNRTAQVWADTSKQRGYIDHKRGNNVYYDYNRIKAWFAGLGVTFTGGGTNFGESIAWNVYSCGEADCTDELISAIRSSFDFFDAEKRTGGPHYEMMVNKGYKQIGLGIAVDKATKKYYLVTHLAVGVAGGSLPYCVLRAQ